jgi:signal transduction histidine kinase
MPIRLRLAAAFAAVAAAVFALGGWAFASRLSSAQLSLIDSQLTVQLTQAARYLPPGSAAGPVTAPNASPPGDYVIQLVDPGGHVRGASPDAGTAPLVTADQLAQARHGRISVTNTADEEGMRIAAAPLAGHPGWVAVAGESLETYDSTQGQVARELAVGGAVFVAVAGLGAYGLARAALSPVERLRRQVAAISGRGETSSIDVPSTRDEIAALAGTMNDLLGRLQGALARQRAFTADASHELRTPLAVLRGELELAIRPGRSREDLAAAVRTAAAEAERLTRLTNDLLLLARSDEDRFSLRRAPTDIGRLLVASAELAASRLAAADVTCRVDARPGTYASLDADRMRQAVDNLVDNAVRFAPGGSVIVLAARSAGTDLDIEVRDDGPGFPADFLPHAFERFRRPDSGRSRGDGGAGLGLAIVRAVVTAHGGVATASNGPGGGAVVRLRLPDATGRP